MRFDLSIASIFLLSLGGASPMLAGIGDCDDDGDTVQCYADNCLLVPNQIPGQLPGALVGQCDTEQDGYGNACDPGITNDGIIGGPDHGPITASFGALPGLPGLPCAGTVPCP
jgi:hypothetical protein